MEGTISRRLAAILCADVAGYSRLMAEDEEGTLRTLASYRSYPTILAFLGANPFWRGNRLRDFRLVMQVIPSVAQGLPDELWLTCLKWALVLSRGQVRTHG